MNLIYLLFKGINEIIPLKLEQEEGGEYDCLIYKGSFLGNAQNVLFSSVFDDTVKVSYTNNISNLNIDALVKNYKYLKVNDSLMDRFKIGDTLNIYISYNSCFSSDVEKIRLVYKSKRELYLSKKNSIDIQVSTNLIKKLKYIETKVSKEDCGSTTNELIFLELNGEIKQINKAYCNDKFDKYLAKILN